MILENKITGNINKKMEEELQKRYMGKDVDKKKNISNGILAISKDFWFWNVWDFFLLLSTMAVLVNDIFIEKYPGLKYPNAIRLAIEIIYYIDIFFNFLRAKHNHIKKKQFLLKVALNYLK